MLAYVKNKCYNISMDTQKINVSNADSTLYIVTGATGFLGNNIARQLLERGNKVRCFARNEEKIRAIFGDKVECVEGDVCNPDDVERAFSYDGPRAVIHSAGVVNLKKDKNGEMHRVNIAGVKAIADECAKQNIKLVHISSVHSFKPLKKPLPMTEPTSYDPKGLTLNYAETKAAGAKYVDELVKNSKLHASIILPSGIVGPYDYGCTYLTNVIVQFNEGKIPAAVKGGYCFVDVRDVASAAISAVDAPDGSYLVTGNYVTVKQLTDYIADALGKKRLKLTLPTWLGYVGLPFLKLSASLTHTEPLYSIASLGTLFSNANFISEKAKKYLDYSPKPTKQTVEDTVAFLKTRDLI